MVDKKPGNADSFACFEGMDHEENEVLGQKKNPKKNFGQTSFADQSSLNLSISNFQSEVKLVDKKLLVPGSDSKLSEDSDEEDDEEQHQIYQDQQEPMLNSSMDNNFYEEILNEEDEEELLRFGVLDWLSVIFPFLRTKNYDLYKKGRSIIENNADITIIMRKLQEFEMFKRLVLDKKQEQIFRNLPKPNLTNLDIVEEEEEDEDAQSKDEGDGPNTEIGGTRRESSVNLRVFGSNKKV